MTVKLAAALATNPTHKMTNLNMQPRLRSHATSVRDAALETDKKYANSRLDFTCAGRKKPSELGGEVL